MPHFGAPISRNIKQSKAMVAGTLLGSCYGYPPRLPIINACLGSEASPIMDASLLDEALAMRVITYRRVSTQEQAANRNGLEAQKTALERFTEREGLEVLADYEEACSGAILPSDRPLLRQALAECSRRGAMLLVSKLDRLSRSVEHIAALMNRGVRFATVEDGLDTEPFMLHLKAVFAERERQMISTRTREALAVKKAQGVAMGARGWKDKEATRAKIAQASRATKHSQAKAYAHKVGPMLVRLQSQGLTMAKMAEEMNALSVPTPTNRGQWWPATVCNTLALYKGTLPKA